LYLESIRVAANTCCLVSTDFVSNPFKEAGIKTFPSKSVLAASKQKRYCLFDSGSFQLKALGASPAFNSMNSCGRTCSKRLSIANPAV
ncbi:MAG: hypothetical protein WBA07_17190, partial [Rivularia sp. (in: cyanobacteria)]